MITPTKLRTGDEVIVVAGKDLGKKGTLRKILKAKTKRKELLKKFQKKLKSIKM